MYAHDVCSVGISLIASYSYASLEKWKYTSRTYIYLCSFISFHISKGNKLTRSRNSGGKPPGSLATILIASRHCVKLESLLLSFLPRFSNGMMRNSEKTSLLSIKILPCTFSLFRVCFYCSSVSSIL